MKTELGALVSSGSRLWSCYAAKENCRAGRHLTLVFSVSRRFSHSYVFLQRTTYHRSPLTVSLYQLFALVHTMAGIILYVLLEEQSSFISFW